MSPRYKHSVPASTQYDLGAGHFQFMENTELPEDVQTRRVNNNLATCDEWGPVCERCPFPECIKPHFSTHPLRSQCPIDVAHNQGIYIPHLVLYFADEFNLLDSCEECERSMDNGRCYYCNPKKVKIC